MEKTLRELCKEVNVTRRAIQGYEKLGLVIASGKNLRGYLLYDDFSCERARRIKFYQELGFSLKEIKQIIDAPNDVLKTALKEQVEKLKSELGNYHVLIKKANELIDSL